MFEGWAITVLRATRTVSDGCVLLNLSWDTAQTIMEGAVKRGIEGREVQNIQRVGIDEKSFGRGQDYISVLTDLDQARVIDVVPGRDKEAGRSLFKTLPAQQLEKVQAVAMDMSETFATAAREMAPQADIVYDRFHVSQALNKAVNQVRKAENKALMAEGDERLKGTRQTWLFNPKNLQDDRLESLSDLARQNLKTSRAWLHKENFEGFWEMESRWHGTRYLHDWYNSAIRSRLEPIKCVARTLKAHTTGLINYFTHRITNAVTEGLNSRIQDLKSAARGFRNFHHYRIRILFFCGKLDLQTALFA